MEDYQDQYCESEKDPQLSRDFATDAPTTSQSVTAALTPSSHMKSDSSSSS